MATVSAPTSSPRKAELIASAREKLAVLDSAGPVSVFGAGAHRYTEDLGAQRLDVEDVVAVGGKAVALMVQRGRGDDDLWVERRLSPCSTPKPSPCCTAAGSTASTRPAASRSRAPRRYTGPHLVGVAELVEPMCSGGRGFKRLVPLRPHCRVRGHLGRSPVLASRLSRRAPLMGAGRAMRPWSPDARRVADDGTVSTTTRLLEGPERHGPSDAAGRRAEDRGRGRPNDRGRRLGRSPEGSARPRAASQTASGVLRESTTKCPSDRRVERARQEPPCRPAGATFVQASAPFLGPVLEASPRSRSRNEAPSRDPGERPDAPRARPRRRVPAAVRPLSSRRARQS